MAMLLVIASGCIKNDIPYPRIPQNIISLVAEGEQKAATINTETNEVTLYLEETVDIQNVKFVKYEYSEGAVTTPDLLEGSYNLSSPMIVTLYRYYDYDWTIKAEQTIERYFSIEGQIGESVIDNIAKRVIVTMPEGTDLKDLTVQQVKHGPE